MNSCCKNNIKTKKCKRKDGKVFDLPRKFSKKKCKGERGFSMKSSCAPYKYCKSSKSGGKSVSKYKKNKLPTLRKIDTKNKKHKYKLDDPPKKRRLAIDEGIRAESKKKNGSIKDAAVAKKARYNILRIYRKNNNKHHCNVLTQDMKYIDRKYKLGETKNICSKKGGSKKGGSKKGGSKKGGSKSKPKSKSKSKNLSRKKLMIYLLNKELKKRFCKCVRSVKFGKNKAKPGEENPICYRSIYINRGIKPPKDVVKTCRKKK
jgi:hypothetical protein